VARLYVIRYTWAPFGVAELLSIAPGTQKAIELVSYEVGAHSHAGVGDEGSNHGLVQVKRLGPTVTQSPGIGGEVTAVQVDGNDTAPAFLAKRSGSESTTTGDTTVLDVSTWQVRTALVRHFPRGRRPRAVNGELLTIAATAPNVALTFEFAALVEER
jgi:hypothetical protein